MLKNDTDSDFDSSLDREIHYKIILALTEQSLITFSKWRFLCQFSFLNSIVRDDIHTQCVTVN